MEDSMYQRLLTAEKRLKEIDEELVSEEIMKNMSRFREISKERAYLDLHSLNYSAMLKAYAMSLDLVGVMSLKQVMSSKLVTNSK